MRCQRPAKREVGLLVSASELAESSSSPHSLSSSALTSSKTSTSASSSPAYRHAASILFAIVVLGAASGNLSQTAVNAMLPEIMSEYGMAVDLGQWLTTSYMLMLGVTVPVATFLSRRFSARQHIVLALTFFFVGIALAWAAPNFGVLLIGRICQAMASGMLMPLMQNIAMTCFPPGRQATAMGIGGIALGFAPNIGPTIGGAFSFAWGWRSFFVLLAGITAALLIATIIAVKSAAPIDRNARLDSVSLMLSTLGFGGVLFAFSNASSNSIISPFVWVPLEIGTLSLVLFVWRQNRVDDPLINMKIFSSLQFRAGFIALNLLFASFMGITLVIPLYVEGLCGGSALEAGMVLLPGTVVALILNPLSGFLTDRVGVRPVSLVSGIFLMIGAVSMVFLQADTPLWIVAACQGVRGMGISGLIGPLTAWSLAELPRPLVSDGSSFSIAVRQACASFGTSLMVFAITVVGISAWGIVTPVLAFQAAFSISAIFAVATTIYIIAKVR